MGKIIDIIKQHREIVSYLFWGVMSTIVSWGTYSMFAVVFENNTTDIHFFGIETPYVVFVSNILSWVCAVLFAFVVNKLWVFQSKSWKADVWLSEFWKFVSARLITGILEIVAVPLLVGIGMNQTILGIEGMVAKVIVSVVVVLLNYVFSKLFIFK